MKSKFFQLLILLCWISADVAAQPNVSAALDSSRILIGDQVKLNVYVEHSQQESIL
jgi:hypothetical protein